MNYLVKVGEGLGFLVHGKEPYIITAATNVPEHEPDEDYFEPDTAEAAAALVKDEDPEEFHSRILGAIDGPQNISAACVYRNEFVAVLACTKSRHFPYETVNFEALIETITPLQVARSPKPRGEDLGIFCEATILDSREKVSVDVLCQGKIAWVINYVPSPRSLGSPILFDDQAIGLIVTPTGLNDSLRGGLRRFLHGTPGDKRSSRLPKKIFHEGGINPFLADILPDFLLKELGIVDSPETEPHSR